MIFPKFILFLQLIMLCYLGSAQDKRSELVDLYLAEDFKLIGEVDSEMRACINPIVERRLVNVLKDSSSFDYAFDSLSKHVRIVETEDKKVRFFTWDKLDGGSWHHIVGHAQYKSESGKVGYKSLIDENVYKTGAFTDVIIYKVQTLELNGQKYYITTGWGTHGSGMHHSTIQIFEIKNGLLIRNELLLGGPYYAVEGMRSSKIDLKYDAATKTIHHNEFVYNQNEFDGFKTPTGNSVTLKLIDEHFVKQ